MSTLCRAEWKWQKCGGAETSENPFFCQTHLSAFLKGGRPPVRFRRSQSQSVAVIISLKRRDHPPSQHLLGLKPLKGRVKGGRTISDYFFRVERPFYRAAAARRRTRSLCGASRAALPIESPCPLARHGPESFRGGGGSMNPCQLNQVKPALLVKLPGKSTQTL
jgi:hypothetical protein